MPSPDPKNLPPPPFSKTGWPWESQDTTFPKKRSVSRTQPKISIVTPSYNQGAFIEETIRSVLMQGYANLEYIVIDGGSTDNTLPIIRKYEPWLTYWTSEEDGGQADAINKGFQRATGEIFAWLNSDDFYEPNAFQRIVQFFTGYPDVVFANGDVNAVGEDSHFIRRIYAMRPTAFFAANYGQHGWPQPGCFWQRSAYDRIGGIDPSLQFCMDKDLFIRLVTEGPGRRVPGPPLANFRLHEGAKSATLTDVAKRETASIIKKYGHQKWASHRHLMHVLWWLYRKQAAVRMRLDRYFGLEY